MNELSRYWYRFRSFILHSREPITLGVLAVWVGSSILQVILSVFFRIEIPNDWVYFDTRHALAYPWTFFLYPLFYTSFFGLLFGGYWLWWIGGSLERIWGRREYSRFLAVLLILPSLSLFIGSNLLKAIGFPFLASFDAGLFSLWTPLAGLTVAWCMLNPNQIIRIYFVLPIKARYLMWAAILFNYFYIYRLWEAPWLAFFALAGVGYAYWYTKQKTFVPYSGQSAHYKPGPPGLLDKAADWIAYFWRQLKRRPPRR